MPKHDFNESARILNEYNLKLRPHCGMTPIQDGDDDPLFQAEVFREKVAKWLKDEGAFERQAVINTETLAPAPDGRPRMRIICTHDVMKSVEDEFSRGIVATDLVRSNVGATRAPEPPKPPKGGDLYPPDKNCWDPTKWQ